MESKVSKKIVLFLAIVLFAVIALGLFWLFSYKGTVTSGGANDLGLFWWIFSFAAGLSMIVLPCTLPLAFVIVPLSMGRGVVKGLGMALSFSIGIALTLSLYGVVAALAGKAALGTLGSDAAETIKNWVYFIAGTFALIFALSEIGLMKFRMPTYTGAAPAFIQKRQDYIKAFLLGLFLGNVGIGCPHPATPLILVEIASSGNVLYGWLLFLIHAVGRILPLIFLAILGIMGVNGLSWLVSRKDKVEKVTGWAMVFVAGFILTLGLFSHDWWVNSGIHTQIEKITHEESLLNIVKENIGSEVTHAHNIETGIGLFGLPLWLGNWFLVFLWIFPIWWWWLRDKKRVNAITDQNQVKEKDAEHRLLMSREKFLTALTIILALVFIYILPHNFLQHSGTMNEQHSGVMEEGGHMEHNDGAPEQSFDESMSHGHDTAGNSITPTQSPTSSVASTRNAVPAFDESMPHGHDATGSSIDSNSADDHMMMGDDHGAHGGEGGKSHEEEDVTSGLVSNFTIPTNAVVGKSVSLKFLVNEKPAGTPVTDLQIEHEKYYHLIGVRDDLTEFFHLHPEQSLPGVWSTDHIFTKGGIYKLWSDVKQDGVVHSFGHPKFVALDGGATTTSLKVPVEFLTNVIVGNYQVAFHYDTPLVKGANEALHFTVKNLYGNGVELDNYLGAQMHLVIIKDDLSQYVHTHPGVHEPASQPEEQGGGHDNSDGHHGSLFTNVVYAHGDAGEPIDPTELSFSTVFPTEGVYKLFAQFRPKDANLGVDEALLAEFYVKIAKEGAKPIPKPVNTVDPVVKWWSLLIISIISMSILSYGVYRYLQVK